jgi:uncharacterized membrane protein
MEERAFYLSSRLRGGCNQDFPGRVLWSMKRFLRVSGWILMFLFATLIAAASLRFFFISPEKASDPALGEKFARHLPLLLTHVTGGIVALFLGPWQFWGGLRRRYPAFHRWLGRVYLLGILAGGLAGLGMAVIAFGGLPSQLGFGGLAVLWLVTGAFALQTIRQGKVRAHREWMIRNYALTFAAVTLRLWLPFLLWQGLEFPVAYPMIAWLCWVPNLVVAEVYLWSARGRGRQGTEVLPLQPAPLP